VLEWPLFALNFVDSWLLQSDSELLRCVCLHSLFRWVTSTKNYLYCAAFNWRLRNKQSLTHRECCVFKNDNKTYTSLWSQHCIFVLQFHALSSFSVNPFAGVCYINVYRPQKLTSQSWPLILWPKTTLWVTCVLCNEHILHEFCNVTQWLHIWDKLNSGRARVLQRHISISSRATQGNNGQRDDRDQREYVVLRMSSYWGFMLYDH